MPLGDIYELTHVQSLYEQEVNNVYFYRQAMAFALGDPTTAQVLADEWNAQILPSIAAIQTDDVSYREIRVKNLFDASDQYSLLISGTGLYTGGDTLPSFAAYSIDMQGDNAAVKRGSKRFAGVGEGSIVDGVVTLPDTITKLGTLCGKLEDPVTVGLLIEDPVFVPVTVKRVRSGSPGAYTYRLPENESEAIWSQIVVSIFDLIISSQLSRKIGVGV